MNEMTFQRNTPGFNSARANAKALKKMTQAEFETGMTVEELAAQQCQMREDFYRRHDA